MKKKTILILLAITYAISISACGQTATNEVVTSEITSEIETVETTPEKETTSNPTEIASTSETTPIDSATTTDAVVDENSTEAETSSNKETDTDLSEPVVEDTKKAEVNSLNKKDNPESAKPAKDKTETKKKKTPAYIVNDISETLYASTACNVRKGPSTDFDKIGSLAYNQEVHVTGKTEYQGKTWYRIDLNGKKGFVSASLLMTQRVKNTPKSNKSSSNSNKSGNSNKSSSSNSNKSSSGGSKSSNKSNSSGPTTGTTDMDFFRDNNITEGDRGLGIGDFK